MKMSLPQAKDVRVDFPVRLMLKEAELKKMRAANMNGALTHIDTVVQLGASDFESDDERLFAVEFADTLKREAQARAYACEDFVPGRLVIKGLSYPVSPETVAQKVLAFLKSGVDAGRQRDEAIGKLSSQIVAAKQMMGPAIQRLVDSKAELVARCRDWDARMKRATKDLDADAFQALQQQREALVRDLPKSEHEVFEQAAQLLKDAVGDAGASIEWSGSTALLRMNYDREPYLGRSQSGKLEASITATVGLTWIDDDVGVAFEAQVCSPAFGPWQVLEEVEIPEMSDMIGAFRMVLKDKSADVFKKADEQRKALEEDKARGDWIAAHGSSELKAAVAHKAPFMGLYARERLLEKCKNAGAEVVDFEMEVDVQRLFWGTLHGHQDPSKRALKLMGEVGASVSGIWVGRLVERESKVNAEHNEVVVVPGESIARGCPAVYLWRAQPKGRGRR